jgi:hypothetical protein
VDDGFESGIGLVERLGELQVADDGLVEAPPFGLMTGWDTARSRTLRGAAGDETVPL